MQSPDRKFHRVVRAFLPALQAQWVVIRAVTCSSFVANCEYCGNAVYYKKVLEH